MRNRLVERAQLYGHCRRFFAERGVLEVETPVLSRATVSDPHLASLATTMQGQQHPYFLQTSPEYAMKRLLAAGAGDCYQICKAFRDGESGRHHNPEFTLLEWYRLGFDHHALMDEVESLLVPLLGPDYAGPAERLSYRTAFERHLQVDPHHAALSTLRQLARTHAQADLPDADRDTVLDVLMGVVVGPALGQGRLSFVHEYPPSQAALARVLPGDPPVAARFEAYAGGLELCNGFQELTDAAEQQRRFSADLAIRADRGLPQPPLDERFLAALAVGLPDCAGVAVGLDRVLMLAMRAAHIDDVLAFSLAES
jgi:lysyl-tRNA synthetase class 2